MSNRSQVKLINNCSIVKLLFRQRINDALDEVGMFVVSEAKVRTPVDTGHLRGSIDYTKKFDSINVGTNVDYGIYVEKGTSKMKAQPYLTPAIEDNRKEIQQIVEKHMKRLYKR